MYSSPYINIHRHESLEEEGTLSIECFLFPSIPPHSPKNFFSYGVHPTTASLVQASDWDIVEKIIQSTFCLFVGEAGLDKLCMAPYEAQLSVLEKQIELSEYYKKPLIIHCVKYYDELIALKRRFNPQEAWIIHGFRGKVQQAEQLIKLGFYLSFGNYFNLDSLALAYFHRRAFLETDINPSSIESLYNRMSIGLRIPIADIRDEIHKMFLQILH